MVSRECSEEYWFVVEKCLVRFHHISTSTARKKIHSLQERLMDGKTLNDLIFHVEPFELACDIGKQDLSVEEHWAEYEKILDSFNPSKTTTMPGLSIKDPSNSNSLRISESSSSRYRPTTESSSKKSVAKKTADSRSVESGSLPRTAASAARKKSAEKASTGKKKIQKK